jgi:hypothetical protein
MTLDQFEIDDIAKAIESVVPACLEVTMDRHGDITGYEVVPPSNESVRLVASIVAGIVDRHRERAKKVVTNA